MLLWGQFTPNKNPRLDIFVLFPALLGALALSCMKRLPKTENPSQAKYGQVWPTLFWSALATAPSGNLSGG